jgi:KDO2-lipid IV(A) lauroyltransferase
VPFFGRLTSTPIGPARIALATGACFLSAFATRTPDGRIVVEVEAPLVVPEPHAPDAVERLTALHVARLEARVRARPEFWFWLHRRWKTPPPSTR